MLFLFEKDAEHGMALDRIFEKNLAFVDRTVSIDPLKESDCDFLLRGLDKVLPEYHLDKIWEMIWGRWQHYESL